MFFSKEIIFSFSNSFSRLVAFRRDSSFLLIKTYVVASDFSDEVLVEKEKDAIRGYVKGYRPAESSLWKNLKLVKYSYEDEELKFEEVN